MITVPIVAAATFALGAPLASDTYISLMRERLVAESPFVRSLGVNPRDFVFRLDFLEAKLSQMGTSTPQAQRDDLTRQTQLELKLDAELLVNLCPYFSGVDGLDESFYNADPHVPPDPVAFYVPPPQKEPYAVVVLLHGRVQTETDVASRELFRSLADRRNAIVVAPWGTGGALWGDAAANEIAEILGELEHGFAIDPTRIYVAGIGQGGDGAFHVASRFPNIFRAVMAIGGGIAGPDAFSAAHAFRSRDVYLVTDRNDVYDFLSASCVPVSRYAATGADVDPYANASEIERAWDDMFDGTVRNGSTRECG